MHMKTKAKKFSHKLLALFMAVIMALTCFTGVITAFGQSVQGRYDDDVEYNSLGWSVLSDEQVATALLDFADEMLPQLKEMEPQLANAINSNSDINSYLSWDIDSRSISVLGGVAGSFSVKLGSVNELLETIQSVNSWLNSGLVGTFKGMFGDAANLDLAAVNGMTRENTSSCDIVRGVLALIQDNTATYSNANGASVIYNLLAGTFSLGSLDGALDLYGIIGDLLGLPDGYQSDLVYNLVKSLLFNYTEWFTQDEITAYNNGTKPFVFDEVLLEKLTSELLCKINVLVTYADGTSSATRKEAIDAKMESDSLTYEEAASALGYDPNLVYTDERGMEGNILLFSYGDDQIELDPTDSLFSFGYQALKMAWNTVLKDTIKLVHVNYDVDRGHGANFDNVYYYWFIENQGSWNQDNLTQMYSEENVSAWANDVYAEYGAESADEFLGWVKDTYVHDRTVADDAKGNWSDIDSTTLFAKLRYSPLADYYFDMQTGPINLYFVQTGTDNLDNFFESDYANYSSLLAALNDCLVAAVDDIFVQSDNIYVNEPGDTDRPTLTETGDIATIDDAAVKSITTTLVNNTLAMVQYVADTTDQNILNGFYKNGGETLSEANLEEAMIPLLIACIGNVNLGSGRLDEIIHPADWDACKDAEAVAFVCLREYLSYILPSKDYDALITKGEDGSIEATLDGTILPMARDAVTYVMEGYVPVYDAEGNPWKVKDREVNDENTLLELLNSVICYYANYYDYADGREDRAMGVANLLGVCDENGNSLITTDNTIWENIDCVANELLPILGELQGKGSGNFDSEDLIWNDVVKGVLEISDTSHASGLGGVSNFIYRLLNIFAADPIQSDTVTSMAYEIVKELINGLFGPRYTGQTYVPVPDAQSTHPFDDLLKKNVLVGSSADNPGAIIKLICNVTEFVGYSSGNLHSYPDTILPGLTFALTAVNSFLNILPDISDHSLTMASLDVADSSFSSCQGGQQYRSSVTFTNNSNGVNIAYIDGESGSPEQISRYYIRIKDVSIEGGTGGSTIDSPSSSLIAPGESVTLNTATMFSPDAGSTSATYTITITYDITDKNGTALHTDLVSRAYQYLTSDNSWVDTVYPESRIENGIYRMPEDLESDQASQTMEFNGFRSFSTAYYGDNSSDNRFVVNYPEYIVLSTDNLSAVDNYGIRVRNQYIGWFWGSAKTCYGFYFYDTTTVRDDRTNNDNVQVNSANAIPVFDKQTGDLLKIGLYDYSTDGGDTWAGTGVTSDVVAQQMSSFIQSNPDNADQFVSRTHVAYTLDQAYNAGIIAAAHQNDRGIYEYVYLQSGSGNYGYDNTLLQISMRGPMDGFYLNTDSNVEIGSDTAQYRQFLQYDGTTAVQGTTEPIVSNICFWHNRLSTTAQLKFVIADTSTTSSVNAQLDELSSILDNYKDTDFTSPQALEFAKNAITNALSTVSTPITPDTAAEISDKTQRAYVTGNVTSETGELAYTPLGAGDEDQIPQAIFDSAYFDEETQLYYYDREFTAPIYSQEVLKSSDVQDGKDPAGIPVTQGEDGNYYYINTPVYEKEWDTATYESPWYKDTNVQATDEAGNELYAQVQFKHYNSSGREVRYVDNWSVRIPDTSYQIIPNDGDVENRGLYAQANDYLAWAIEQVYGYINTDIAEDLLNNISLVRNGMNTNNFDVLTYNRMVDLAKTAESQYTINLSYTEEEAVIDEEGNTSVDDEGNVITQSVAKTAEIPFSEYNNYADNPAVEITDISVSSHLSSVQVDEYVRLFDLYMDNVMERGYQGDKIEAEIECASGNTYDNLVVTKAVYNEDGEITSPAVVSKGAGAVEPKFGAWSEDGTLVNEGETVYSAETWDAYVTALADAVYIAQLGNGDYEYKDYKKYDYENADAYEAQISDVYYTDTALQAAEIALEEDIPEELTISGTVMVATDLTGTEYTGGVGGIGIYVGDELVATSAEDGTFTAAVPLGTTELTLKGSTTIDRTVTLSGTADVTGAVIPIVVCDYNHDGSINATDSGFFAGEYGTAVSDSADVYYDLSCDKSINATDSGLFATLYGNVVTYASLALD